MISCPRWSSSFWAAWVFLSQYSEATVVYTEGLWFAQNASSMSSTFGRRPSKEAPRTSCLSASSETALKLAGLWVHRPIPSKGVVHFDFYGHKVFAVNHSLPEPLASRCLPIVPPEVHRQISSTSDEQRYPKEFQWQQQSR